MNQPSENEFHTVRGYQLKKREESGLTPALEDYLEMAYRLCLEETYTRVNKISERLHVRPSSTSKMVFKLVALGYLAYDSCESILLTDAGRKTGAYLLERHNTVERFLVLLGSANALEEAELVEHSLSPGTVLELKALLAFFEENRGIEKQFRAFWVPGKPR